MGNPANGCGWVKRAAHSAISALPVGTWHMIIQAHTSRHSPPHTHLQMGQLVLRWPSHLHCIWHGSRQRSAAGQWVCHGPANFHCLAGHARMKKGHANCSPPRHSLQSRRRSCTSVAERPLSSPTSMQAPKPQSTQPPTQQSRPHSCPPPAEARLTEQVAALQRERPPRLRPRRPPCTPP